jgi:hypothetical protein
MSGRFHTRGRNTHWSDGRPAGFVMKPAPRRRRFYARGELRLHRPSLVDVMRAKGPRLTTIAALAVTAVAILHFGSQLLLALAYGAM